MKATKFAAWALIPALALTAGVTFADSKEHREGKRIAFEQLDSNSDGQVTLEEMAAMHDLRFAQTDSDGDGALSAEELAAGGHARAERRAARMLDRMDANDDGLIQKSEMKHKESGRRGERMFARADTDDSGGLSREEFQEAGRKMRHHGKGGAHKPQD